MLEVELKKELGNFKVETAFATTGNGVTALFGHSGAGKSSVINMIAGLVRPDEGRIVVNGRCVFDRRQGIHVPPDRRRFGYVFQEDRLFPHLTVESNLTYGMKRVPQKEHYVELDSVVDLLGIGHLLSRRPGRLSGGEKQRVAIGRALLTSPVLLLMDEPLASLDAARKKELLPFIAKLPRELSVPILYVSHSVDEILNLADMIVLLDSGSVVANGTVEEVAARSDFQQLTGLSERGVVWSTTVESHSAEEGITRLRFDGGSMCIARAGVPVGEKVRIRIHPRNVGIALEEIRGTSIQNVFPARVQSTTDPLLGAPVQVELQIGETPLLASVTPKAALELGLKPGKNVYAMIKSVSISLGYSFTEDKSGAIRKES